MRDPPRLVAHGPRFFRDPWSVFDFVIVGIALIPASGAFSVLRALLGLLFYIARVVAYPTASATSAPRCSP
ncbi:MAG: hypothetical protein ACRDS9_01175 [Pseudonocardiaceae bacterium]